MDIIFGGAFQGKLNYAKEKYKARNDDICFCAEDNIDIDYSKKIFYGLNNTVLALADSGQEPLTYFKENFERLADKVLIFNDISCGVVPVDSRIRRLREDNGRVMAYLCGKAESVVRIFCGLECRIR